MLVPDKRVVPPPSFVERMPTEEMKQPLLMFSLSSPGAEIVTVVPSVVKKEAVSALMTPENQRHELVPSPAVVEATAMTSENPAGTMFFASFAASFPAATTTVTPEL